MVEDAFEFSLSFSPEVHKAVRECAQNNQMDAGGLALYTAQVLLISRETMTESLFYRLSLEFENILRQIDDKPKKFLGVVRDDNETPGPTQKN